MMTDQRVKAAELILDRGVRFRLPASFVSRLLRRDRIDIHPLKAGTILEFSREVIKGGLEEAVLKNEISFLEQSIGTIARCIAIAVLNDEDKIKKLTGKLAHRLLWKLPSGNLIEIFQVIANLNRVSDFTAITKFLLSQTMMMMNPRNLGHELNGG